MGFLPPQEQKTIFASLVGLEVVTTLLRADIIMILVVLVILLQLDITEHPESCGSRCALRLPRHLPNLMTSW